MKSEAIPQAENSNHEKDISKTNGMNPDSNSLEKNQLSFANDSLPLLHKAKEWPMLL